MDGGWGGVWGGGGRGVGAHWAPGSPPRRREVGGAAEGRFSIFGVEKIFNLCSHIESNTQNPNPIFKIAICFTKTPKTPKYFRTFGTFSKNLNFVF